MFGTLVIALPSEHEGGEIVLKHCGQTKIFKSSQHEASWACWYSDVSHQILPVKSGYRWVLTFNLALTPYPGDPAPPSGVHLTAHSKREELSVIRQTLQTWLSTRPSMRTHHELFHTLDHDYTEANVSWATLKGRDLAQVLALRSLSKELPFDIFLALLEKESVEDEDEDDWAHNRYMMEEEEEDYDEDDVEYEYERRNTNNTGNTVFEQTHRVRTLRDLDDKIVVTDLDFTPKNMLDSQFFDEIDPDDEEHTGFTGNEVSNPN